MSEVRCLGCGTMVPAERWAHPRLHALGCGLLGAVLIAQAWAFDETTSLSCCALHSDWPTCSE